jgi:23S rRNA (guanosine2251-2'-O)-methyltransferase
MAGVFACGLHTVAALLNRRPERVVRLFAAENRTESRMKAIVELARLHDIEIEPSTQDRLKKMSGGVAHQGIVAEIIQAVEKGDKDLVDLLEGLPGNALLLVLDQVQDPHNLGACLRTAEAAGVDAVILPRAHSASLTPVVRKVASGAADLLDIFSVGNLSRALDTIKAAGVWLVGTSDTADTSIYNLDLKIPLALVMGGEGPGLRRLTIEKCDYLAHLPMAGTISSLNVSVATGVCLFEVVRQRSN